MLRSAASTGTGGHGSSAPRSRAGGPNNDDHTTDARSSGIDDSEFGTIIRVITRTLAARPDAKEWHDYTVFVARGD